MERVTTCMGLALSVLAVAGCGGGATEARSTNDATRFGSDAQNEHSIADSVDGMKIEGIKGSLPARDVNEALEPRFPKFQKCFMRRYKAVEVLAGTMELSFVVSIDGRVKEVFPHASDVGDRATERCVLDVARSTSFPRPQGGEAEFSWSFTMDPISNVRAPDPAEITELGDEVKEALGACGSLHGVTFTAYVAPGARLLAAGASAPDAATAERLDCATEAFQAYAFGDYGSYVAKLTLTLP